MLKHTVMNAGFSAAAQSASMAAIFFLAAQKTANEFGELILQLSYAALISAVLTLQFERVYVLQSRETLSSYVAFHLKLVSGIHLVVLGGAVWLGLGSPGVLLGYGIALTQIANYCLARQGRFRKIWLLKVLQGSSLLFGVVVMWGLGKLDFAWVAFFLSNLICSIIILDRRLLISLRGISIGEGWRLVRESFPVAWKSLMSLSASTLIREMPVYVAGYLGQSTFAAAYGLVVRTVGAPVALIARSAAAVVSSYVARGLLNLKRMLVLGMVPFAGAVIVMLFYFLIPEFRMFDEYDDLRLVLVLAAPYFIVKAYTGLLGPAIVYYRLQGLEVGLNLALLIFNIAVSMLVYLNLFDLLGVLLSISVSSFVLMSILVVVLARKVWRVSNKMSAVGAQALNS